MSDADESVVARLRRESDADLRERELQREATAATILAALFRHADDLQFDPSDQRRVAFAVRMADALRAELSKGGGA